MIGALAMAYLATPASAQFPAESTIPKAQRHPRRLAVAPTNPAPHTADGKPDLSGVWGYAGYTSDIAKDYDVGEVPMTALGDKLFKERQAKEGVDDPEARCLPTGVPRRDPYPSKIIQQPNLVVVLFEGNLHSFRQIFLDRKEHPADLNPTWWGDSIDIGKTINWWWTRWVSTEKPGSIWLGILPPINYMSSNAIRVRISDT